MSCLTVDFLVVCHWLDRRHVHRTSQKSKFWKILNKKFRIQRQLPSCVTVSLITTHKCYCYYWYVIYALKHYWFVIWTSSSFLISNGRSWWTDSFFQFLCVILMDISYIYGSLYWTLLTHLWWVYFWITEWYVICVYCQHGFISGLPNTQYECYFFGCEFECWHKVQLDEI